MKSFEWLGQDIWVCIDGEWKHICKVSPGVSAVEIVEALNEHEHVRWTKRHQDDKCARYKARNEQFPLKKKVDY
jgi:hypothetical protein